MTQQISDRIALVEAYVRGVFAASDEGAHTYDHTQRVYRLAIEIGEKMNANLEVLAAAALLHDVGRGRETETGISHAILSARMGQEVLKRAGYTPEEIEQITDAIRTHRFSEGLTPNSLEGKILSDADKLDAIGAIGVFRAIAQAAVSGRGIKGFLEHADDKLLRLRDMMYTDVSRERAQRRHQVLLTFVQELRTELESGTSV